jgi:hypothetical protein
MKRGGGRYAKTQMKRPQKEAKMPAIATLKDLKAAQQDLLESKDLEELKAAFRRWRHIGWKNVCKLWLEERTPEQLKGEADRGA